MAKQITFEEARKLLSKGKADPQLLRDVDTLMGVMVLFAPLAVGLPPGVANAVVGVLGARGGLIKLGERIIEGLAKRDAGDEVDRYRAMELSHLLIVYSAFFDAISKEIPDFWKTLALDKSIQTYLTDDAREQKPAAPAAAPTIPHPLVGFKAHLEELKGFYRTLSQVIAGYLNVLKIADINAAAKANEYAELRKSLVERSVERYQAQYLELARQFPAFHIYANFHFQEVVDTRLRALSEAADQSTRNVDVGFTKLAAAIDQMDRKPAVEALADLRRRSEANNLKPIYPKSIPGLTFPRRSDIFLPQAYRAVRYRTGMRLDSEEAWRDVPVGEDLGPFLTRCLESPSTIDKPILILGQPGSGKSMLTHMISSVLGGRFDTVRVELRSVHADARIYSQIQEFVAQETQGRLTTWPDIRDKFTAPAVVILDGFDELLQAAGRVFAAYLTDCAEFQAQSLDLGRPLRTIVTSRIALINRAHIPDDSIVIRLEPFDAPRVSAWVAIWNRHNAGYFCDPDNQTVAFSLAQSQPAIRELASQPLLLMMLAIYDSDRNRLAQQRELKTTALYHSLVRSFVEREEERSPGFSDLSAEDREDRIDDEIRRLGVAGLTMFNRRKRDIRRAEVDEALATFGLTYDTAKEGQPLGQAERLFGRFFFVMKSETATQSAGEASYEFLHATFGEFLAAYSIARRVIDSCEAIAAQKKSERRDYVRKPDAFPRTWFECLMHAPLFGEPVVLAMLREWLPQEAGLQADTVLAQLEAVVVGQAEMLLEGGRFPDPFKSLPALGHAAIYSVNLVTLLAAVKGSFDFDEGTFQSYPDETRPWDRLTHLWRSWFSLRVLANLGSVVTVRREESIVTVVARESIGDSVAPSAPGMERLHRAAGGLGDRVLLGLSGYFLADSLKLGPPTLDEADRLLTSEGYPLGVFAEFRRVPIEHGARAAERLLQIVGDDSVPNLEIWARAIQMLTSEPNRYVEWSEFLMVRELRSITEHLIVNVASPEDCEAFFSGAGRPVQLVFAKRSGGKERYRETYAKVKTALLSTGTAGWTPEDYVAAYEAASYFEDRATAKRISESVNRVTDREESLPTSEMSRIFVSAVRGQRPGFSRLLTSTTTSKRRSRLGWVWRLLFSAGPNPYLPGYAETLRRGNLKGDASGDAVKQLLTCLDLPIDVRIELLDRARILGDKIDAHLRAELEFPFAQIGDMSLAAVPSARRVAEWMSDSKALEAIDQLVITNAPPFTVAS